MVSRKKKIYTNSVICKEFLSRKNFYKDPVSREGAVQKKILEKILEFSRIFFQKKFWKDSRI